MTVKREIEHSDDWLTVAFATSDLTARGIDSDAYRDCSKLKLEERNPVSGGGGVLCMNLHEDRGHDASDPN